MCGGLEICEVSSIDTASADRFDAEYFGKSNLAVEKLSKSIGGNTISGLNGKLDCSAFYPSVADSYSFEGIGVPFLRVDDIQSGLVHLKENTAFLSKSIIENNSRTIAVAYPGDIVIAKGGNTLAKVGIIGSQYGVYATCRDLIVLRTQELTGTNRYLLWAYLHSRYGQSLLWRSASQTGQPHLTLSGIRDIIIPAFKDDFQDAVKKMYVHAMETFTQSIAAYAAASTQLLDALCMTNFAPDADAVTVKMLSNSFGASGRLDAEYYQKKYDGLFAALGNLKCDVLGNIASITKSIEPGSEYYGDEGVPFVRISDISKYDILTPRIKIPANLTDLRPIKDTVLLSKDGSVGVAYKVEQDLDMITSGALLHLRVKRKDVLPDYLALVLNSVIVHMQAERDAGGSIIQHWKPSEIAKVAIPVLDVSKQAAITAQVQRSFELRRQSERLLDCAKRAVELAIEEGEDKALGWLEKVM